MPTKTKALDRRAVNDYFEEGHSFNETVAYFEVKAFRIAHILRFPELVQRYVIADHTLDEAAEKFALPVERITEILRCKKYFDVPVRTKRKFERMAFRKQVKAYVAAGNSIPTTAAKFRMKPVSVSHIAGYCDSNLTNVSDREVYDYIYGQGHTIRETARHFGIVADTVRVIITRVQKSRHVEEIVLFI